MGLQWGLESAAITQMTFKGNTRYFTSQTNLSNSEQLADSANNYCKI